ncbi:unnamed protein product [Periconia digitata]|uniref:Uncharacterized protein n=1 Tax=Periconia digitata TaxID=1303443 RepID=A0A9W4UUY7_9PLEO|nr:unnamed protein product [Periconia digitata]
MLRYLPRSAWLAGWQAGRGWNNDAGACSNPWYVAIRHRHGSVYCEQYKGIWNRAFSSSTVANSQPVRLDSTLGSGRDTDICHSSISPTRLCATNPALFSFFFSLYLLLFLFLRLRIPACVLVYPKPKS